MDARAKAIMVRAAHIESMRIQLGNHPSHAHAILRVNGRVADARGFPQANRAAARSKADERANEQRFPNCFVQSVAGINGVFKSVLLGPPDPEYPHPRCFNDDDETRE